MEDSVKSYSSISITKVCVQMEEDFKNHLPPWSESSFSQRLHITMLYFLICLPVLILLTVIIGGYSVYVSQFLYYLIISDDDSPELYYWHSESEKSHARVRGVIYFAIETISVSLVLVCHYKAMTTDPGSIPDTQSWLIPSDSNSEGGEEEGKLAERSRKGLARSCNHCKRKKPDRTHHCRQCNRCNLKMDHHCNWIANCVGYYNYKFFFLIVFYGSVALGLFAGTFWECVVVVLNDSESSTFKCLFTIMSYSLISLLSIAVIGFCGFHIWMMRNNYTTIEFCEKKRKDVPGYENSPFMLSEVVNNFKEALGDTPWLWLIPVNDRKTGSGLYYR